MKKQLITIAPGGQLRGLQTKPGKGMSLRQFGKAKIERTTLIEHNDDKQAFVIRFLTGKLGKAKTVFRHSHFPSLGVEGVDVARFLKRHSAHVVQGDTAIYFHEYDDAVAAEIEIVQNWRRNPKYKHLV